MSLRILIVSPFPPSIGGVSVSSERLFNNLIEEGFDVEKYNIIKYGHHPFLKIIVFFLIPFYIFFRKKYDIIHFHVPSKLRKIYVALFSPLYKSAKLIFTLHGDVKGLINDKLTVWALNKADGIICVQPGDSQKMPISLRKKSRDIPAFIMPQKITEHDIPKDILTFVKKKDSPLLLFYGAIKLQQPFYDLYGIEDLLKLFDFLATENIEFKSLMLVTYKKDDTESLSFLQRVEEFVKQKNNIKLVKSPNFSMLPLFKYADIYVRPTKTDGDSLAVRESLQMNCAVVASNCSVRPTEVLTYTTIDEFKRITAELIRNPKLCSMNPSTNYYEEIKSLYYEIATNKNI